MNRTTPAMALKAEVLLGLQLVTRHRAPRLALLLSLGLVLMLAASRPNALQAGHVMLVTGGMVAAVAASRLLALGPAFAAGRMVVAPWWLVPVFRLVGAMVVVASLTLAVALALGSVGPESPAVLARAVAITMVYSFSLAACTMGLTPAWGASGAASAGFLSAWIGTEPPSVVAMLFAPWPVMARVLLWLWNLLPLPWRGRRWLAAGGWADPSVLVAWGLIGIGLAAWYLAGQRRARPVGD